MRWTLFRRKPKQATAPTASAGVADLVVERTATVTGPIASGPLLAGAALRFAREYLLATGAKVRVQSPEHLTGITPGGEQTHYTSSVARAKGDTELELLAPGAPALARMIAEVDARAAVISLRLPEAFDARDTLRRLAHTLSAPVPPVDRCVIEPAADALAIELTYELRTRWRGGGSHEWITICLDTETIGHEPVLPLELMSKATVAPLPPDATQHYERIAAAGDDAIAPALTAIGRWLRLRSESDFTEKYEELRLTTQRLIGESSDDRAAYQEAFEREAERLRDVFEIAVEATLSRVCFIASPIRLVRDSASGGATVFRVDLGRGSLREVGVRSAERENDSLHLDPATHLRAEELSMLPQRFWKDAVTWVLEFLGYTIERVDTSDSALQFTTRIGDERGRVIAVRRDPGARLTGDDLSAALASPPHDGLRVTIFTPNHLDHAAREALTRVGASNIGMEAIDDALARLSHAFEDQRAASITTAEMMASRAAAMRLQVLGYIETLQGALVQAVNTRRAVGGDVARSARVIQEIRAVADQVFVAWETWLADWQELFPERAARDGSLRLLAGEERLSELSQRAEHLFSVTRDAFTRFPTTPGAGEMGYTAWRKAIVEELTARCEALRWQMAAHNPERWRDFASVMDTQAQVQAATARTLAAHARARADSSFAQLATRARI